MPEAASLQEDSWIEAEGTIDIGYYNGVELPDHFELNNGKTYRSLLNRTPNPIDILISM
ncbi:TIGR03943 family protein OS=Lysinibacillus sphaericus OX=1421 GN=LS41612_12720 PE=4 SV=1 [Lysinibacillus sphaericus]